jgi:hypothetical protein
MEQNNPELINKHVTLTHHIYFELYSCQLHINLHERKHKELYARTHSKWRIGIPTICSFVQTASRVERKKMSGTEI